jgi:hypothetical protein
VFRTKTVGTSTVPVGIPSIGSGVDSATIGARIWRAATSEATICLKIFINAVKPVVSSKAISPV